MGNRLKRAVRVTAFAAVAGLAAGCATTGELEEVRTIANNALSTANQARDAASAAQSAASDAATAASQAQQSADAAQACCNENADKIERAFEMHMRK